MLKNFCILFLILVPLFLFGQTQEDIEEALNQIAPALGGVVNDAVLQNANTLGGLPHFRITAGMNLRTVKFTDPNDPNNNIEWTTGAINLEGRLGLFAGKSLGPTAGGFGSTDLLLRMAFYPMGEGDTVSFVPLFGIGLKVALMRESLAMPAISATIQYTASSQFSLEDNQSETYAKFLIRVFSLRADVSKNLFIVTPYAGIGFNYNSLDADIWYWEGFSKTFGEYSVSPSVFKFYVGLNKQIFFLGLNLEGGMSGDSFYGALGISAGM